MPSTRTRSPPKKAFGPGGKLSQLRPGSSSGHPLIDDSPRQSRETSPTQSDLDWVENDAPLEDDEDHAAQNALYDMTRTAADVELMERDIQLGGVDPRVLASPATPKRGRPRKTDTAKKTTTKRLRRIQASVTVSVVGGVTDSMWRRICRWVDDQHEIDKDFAAYIAVEKGLREGGLHLQCVVDMLATSPLLINRRVRAATGLDEDGVDGKVMAKTLTGRNLHTWVGMLGYCQKDHGRPWFKNYYVNVDEQDLERGTAAYISLGAGDVKSRTKLDSGTLLPKMQLWAQYKCAADPNVDPVNVLRDMLRSGLFIPTMNWIIPPGT